MTSICIDKRKKTRIALIGAGAIGRAHLNGALLADNIEIVGVADPNSNSRNIALEFGVPWFSDYRDLIEKMNPEGAIVASPNELHVPIGIDLVNSGVAVLVEKPISDQIEDALYLTLCADENNVPLLVGHHRRHNKILAKARELVASGCIGQVAIVNILAAFQKPDSYYEQTWRKSMAGGPVLINLIHEIDLIRFVCGEIESLQAVCSNRIRNYEVEDTAAVLLKLENGALVTITLCDATPAPWNWDLSSGESAAFPNYSCDSHYILGTKGSLTLPRLRLWSYPCEKGWHNLLQKEVLEIENSDPYIEQIRHFGAVIRGEEKPLVTGKDAIKTLEITQAIRKSSQTGEVIYF